MSKRDKVLVRILRGSSDASIQFSDLCMLLEWLGFEMRVRGSHHIFTRDNFDEILNLQPIGSKAKSYQVKQVREVIIRYKLGGSDADES